MQKVEKVDMAFQQLEDALIAYFAGRYHTALVLAAAAEQLYAGYIHLHGLESAFMNKRKTIVKIANGLRDATESSGKLRTEKDIGGQLNRAYNHSHHAGKTDLQVWMNPKFEAQETIDRAISNFDALISIYDLPDLPLAQIFVKELTETVSMEEKIMDTL